MALWRILRDFSGWTSAHGIPHIGSSRNTCLRIFWVLMFTASAIMFAVQVKILVTKYLRYEVIVDTDLRSDDRSFPVVTICNINPFKSSQITAEETPEMWELLSAYRSVVAGNWSTGGEDKWGFDGYQTTFVNATTGKTVTNTTALVGLQRRARDHLMLIGSEYNENFPDRMRRVTYPIEEVVESCSYGRSPLPQHGIRKPYSGAGEYQPGPLTCDRTRDFKANYDASYGLCYSFNDMEEPRKASYAGPHYGLRLVLRSEQREYLELTESAGMRLAVHSQGEEPFVDAFGYNAAAGFTTSFSIKYIHTARLGPPYGNCSSAGGAGPNYYPGTYSVEGCYRTCLQDLIHDTCGCYDPRYAVPEGSKNALCGRTDVQCLAKFSVGEEASENTFNPAKQCDCLQICSESTYGVTVASAVWPSKTFQAPNKTHFKSAGAAPSCPLSDSPKVGWDAGRNLAEMEACRSWYGNNTINVEIYWERLNYEMLSEKPAYSVLSMVSDFGGMAGLWLGVSVITFVEVLSLLLLLCLFACKRRVPGEDEDGKDELSDDDDGLSQHDLPKDPYEQPSPRNDFVPPPTF